MQLCRARDVPACKAFVGILVIRMCKGVSIQRRIHARERGGTLRVALDVATRRQPARAKSSLVIAIRGTAPTEGSTISAVTRETPGADNEGIISRCCAQEKFHRAEEDPASGRREGNRAL